MVAAVAASGVVWFGVVWCGVVGSVGSAGAQWLGRRDCSNNLFATRSPLLLQGWQEGAD